MESIRCSRCPTNRPTSAMTNRSTTTLSRGRPRNSTHSSATTSASSDVVANRSATPTPSTSPACGPKKGIPTVRVRRYKTMIETLPPMPRSKSGRRGQRSAQREGSCHVQDRLRPARICRVIHNVCPGHGISFPKRSVSLPLFAILPAPTPIELRLPFLTGPLLYGQCGDAEGITQGRRVRREAHHIEQGHHVRHLADVGGETPGGTQRDQGHVERAYLLPTGPSEALEGAVEGNGLWASQFVTT